MSSHDDAILFVTRATIERFELDPALSEITINDLSLVCELGGFTAWAQIRIVTEGKPFPVNRAIRARVWPRSEPSVMWYRLDMGDDA